MLHNLKFICPIIATYVIVIQLHEVYLLSVGEINSYRSICIRHSTIVIFLLALINLNEVNTKEVVLADDFSVAAV